MALGQAGRISVPMTIVGIIAFILGIFAENKKPALGEKITLKDGVLCKFPNDPTVSLGSVSVVFLLVSTTLGFVSVFYPYKGKPVPAAGLFRNKTLLAFFAIATIVSIFGGVLMLWATITEGVHRHNAFHHDDSDCATAKTGLFGGAAFLILDSTLFWLICQMLTMNSRADYFEEEEDRKGSYGQVLTTDMPVA